MKTWKKLTLIAVLAGTLVACAGLDQLQRQVIFRPSKTVGVTPQTEGVAHEDVALTVDGERMLGWWIPAAQRTAQSPAVLYLHGSGFSLSPNLPRILRLHEAGFDVLAIDYRGFGGSDGGLPTETGVYADAKVAWLELTRRTPHAKRYIYGHSLGGAIAVDLAANVSDAAGLIVESSFTSVREMLPYTAFRWIPLAPVQTQYFDSISKMKRICVPVLVLHGTNDYRIPTDMAQALYDSASGPKRIEIVQGARHIDIPTRHNTRWRAAIADFRALEKPAACGEQKSAAQVAP